MKIDNGKILVVDDESVNRLLLIDLLGTIGFDVVEAEDGLSALAYLRKSLPDAILLDVMMPTIDGFEICRLIKENPETAHLPVLLVTALDDGANRLKGIQAGADDFITKPINNLYVCHRVKNAVRTKRLYDELQKQLEEVRALEKSRDGMVHMLVHDMRSPLGAMVGSIDLLKMVELDRLSDEGRDYVKYLSEGALHLQNLINDVLDVSRAEAVGIRANQEQCAPLKMVDEALSRVQVASKDALIEVDREALAGLPNVACDHSLTIRVIDNLLGNAIKFSPKEESIELSAAIRGGDQLHFSVKDHGCGIKEEYQNRIFDKYGQADDQGRHSTPSTGLGLTFCKLAMEAMGGKIGVKSEPGEGSEFWFELPIESEVLLAR